MPSPTSSVISVLPPLMDGEGFGNL